MNKLKSIKFSDYFKINNPEYVYLRLIANSSIKNNKTTDIAKIINNIHIAIKDRFKKQNKGFEYNMPAKASFIVDITKDNACFYMIVPKLFLKEFTQKLTEVFGKITIEEVESINSINSNSTQYSLSYSKDDSLSLTVDKRDNDLLSANLSVMDILQDKDRVTIVYNFLPQSKFSINAWKNYHKDMMIRYKNGACLDKELTFNKIVLTIGNLLFSTIDTTITVVQSLFGGKESKNSDRVKSLFIPVQELSKESITKEKSMIINTQILIYSQSESEQREEQNARTLINTFECINKDNKLVAKKIKSSDKKSSKNKINPRMLRKNSCLIKDEDKKDIPRKRKLKEKNVNLLQYDMGTVQNKISCEESSNFISLPGRSIINEYKIEAIQNNETVIPSELQGGSIKYGTNTYRGKSTTVTTSVNDDAACMPIVMMSKMGGGKSSLFENFGVDSIKNKEALINIDFIKNCEVSDNIIRNIDKDKVVIVDFSDTMNLQGLGFNEINLLRDENNPLSIYECASLQHVQIVNFLDTLNDEPLSASMNRYLDAACMAVLIHKDKSIKDVVSCLENFEKRYMYIKEFKEFAEQFDDDMKDILLEDIQCLTELDEYDGKGKDKVISGTKLNKIEGILSRIMLLKKNSALKFMYIKSTKNNINLVECMQQGKAVFFKLPQSKFSSPIVKNVLVSYLFSKINVAAEIRASIYGSNLRIVNVMCDEIQQARGSFENIGSMSYQMRKFRTKLILSCHGFHSISPIKDILIDAGASIMLLKGSSTKNFEVMQDEFEKFGFTKDDLVALSHTEEYKALCLIASKRGRYGALVRLPKPVKNKIELQTLDFKDDDNEILNAAV